MTFVQHMSASRGRTMGAILARAMRCAAGVWLAASAGSLAACATARAPETTGELHRATLAETDWIRADDADAAPHFATLSFSASDASGYSGCAGWTAHLRAAGATLIFSAIRPQTRHCEAGAARAAQASFLRALRMTRSFTRDGDELNLRSASGASVARFIAAPPAAPSEGH